MALSKNVTHVSHPLIESNLGILRDKKSSSKAFRQALHEISQILLYEATRSLDTVPKEVTTPLEKTTTQQPARPIVLVPILRAGLGMVHGIEALLPDVSIGHIGLARNEETLQPDSYYCNLPEDLDQSDVYLLDPMLATGNSAVHAANLLKEQGAKNIHFLCLLSAPEGLKTFTDAHSDIALYTAAIDRGLNDQGYILPGLGDAGDRYFGTL